MKLHTWYSYECLKAKDFESSEHEFGHAHYRGCFLHKEEDRIVISYRGARIFEACSENVYKFIIPKNFSSAVTTRWSAMFEYCFISAKKKISTAGVVSYKIDVTYNDKSNLSITTTSREITLAYDPSTRQINFVEQSDQFNKVEKDSAKYRLFNTNLKTLKTIVLTRTKMGVYDDVANRSKYRPSYEKNEKLEKALNECITWSTTKDESLVSNIVTCFLDVFPFSYARPRGNEDIQRRLMRGFKAVQQMYLRTQCVTIHAQHNSLSLKNEHHKNSQLLSSSGL